MSGCFFQIPLLFWCILVHNAKVWVHWFRVSGCMIFFCPKKWFIEIMVKRIFLIGGRERKKKVTKLPCHFAHQHLFWIGKGIMILIVICWVASFKFCIYFGAFELIILKCEFTLMGQQLLICILRFWVN